MKKLLNNLAKWLLVKTCVHDWRSCWTDGELDYDVQPYYDSYVKKTCKKCGKEEYSDD